MCSLAQLALARRPRPSDQGTAPAHTNQLDRRLRRLRGQLRVSRADGRFTSRPTIERLREAHASRVRQGDLDHLVFYFASIKGLHFAAVDRAGAQREGARRRLEDQQREAFLHGGDQNSHASLTPVRARIARLLVALGAPTRDARLIYFGELVKATFADSKEREPGIVREYLRVMRFVYEKEFVAQRSPRPADAVADLYRSRGLSTDTAVEAGYVVSIGLGIVKALEPDRRIRRVLIVGPGLDLGAANGTPRGRPAGELPAMGGHGCARLSRTGPLRRPRGGCRRHQPPSGVTPASRARRTADAEPGERNSRQRDRDAVCRIP